MTTRTQSPALPSTRAGLDPRTALLLVLATGIAMSLPAPEPFMPVAAGLGIALLASERAWRRLLGFGVAGAVLASLAYVVPQVWAHPASAGLGFVSAYLLRFLLIAALGSHLIATISPARLTAALRAARLPRAIVVPLAVTLRFLPVVATETRAVWDAMRLRGMARTRDLLAHPLRFLEWLTVPAIAATLRVGEDLSASALLRGLGSHQRPTSIQRVRFGPVDAVAVLCASGGAALGWWLLR